MTDQEIENAVRAAGGQWDGDVWRFEDADLHPFVRSILADRASRSRAASEPGEVAATGPASEPDLNEILAIADEESEDSREDGNRLFTREGVAKFARRMYDRGAQSSASEAQAGLPAVFTEKVILYQTKAGLRFSLDGGLSWLTTWRLAGVPDGPVALAAAAAPLPASSPVAAEGQNFGSVLALKGAERANLSPKSLDFLQRGADALNAEVRKSRAEKIAAIANIPLATPTASMADAADAERFRRMVGVVRCSVKGVMLDDTSGIEQWRSAVDRIATPGPRGENAGGVVEAWRPIETAPRDGTGMLALWVHEGDSVTARNYALVEFVRGCWRDTESDDQVYTEPTHWQPLPPAPDRGLRIAEKGDAS